MRNVDRYGFHRLIEDRQSCRDRFLRNFVASTIAMAPTDSLGVLDEKLCAMQLQDG